MWMIWCWWLRDGGAYSALVGRVHCEWGKIREMSEILTRKDESLKLKGKVYLTCLRSAAMVYGCQDDLCGDENAVEDVSEE